jgi:hypothetical protein
MTKTKRYKTPGGNQYSRGNTSVCVLTPQWRAEHGTPKETAMLFVGCAYGKVSREFAADIIRQFRRDDKREGSAR